MTSSLCALLVAGVCVAAAPAPSSPDPFSPFLVRHSDLSRFAAWTEMEARHPDASAWADVVGVAAPMPLLRRLAAVRRAVGAVPYVPWPVRWRRYYVETPSQLRALGGSCEDYAVAELYALEAAGVPAADLRVAVVEGGRAGHAAHAVLAARVGRATLVLDDLFPAPTPWGETGYRLEYAISPEGWWAPKGAR